MVNMDTFKLSPIEDAVKDFKEGKFVIVVDDEDRENEGDFITSAEMITPEKVNFMLQEGRGVLCAPITISRSEELELPHQVSNNTSMLGTPFTVTVDKLEGCTTGVSAHDRAATIRALADPASRPETFGRPAISTLCMHKTKACSDGPDIRRQPSTWPDWPACNLPPPSSRF